MVRTPELVKLGELHHVFVFDPETIVARHDDGGIGEWLRREGLQGMAASDMTLRDLFDRASIGPGAGQEELISFVIPALDSQ